jgi:glucosylceramidase
MKRLAMLLVVALLTFFQPAWTQSAAKVWLTTLDKTALLSPQPSLPFSSNPASDIPSIVITDSVRQTIDGFGFALTGGSAQHLMNMSAPERRKLLSELFGRGQDQVGISYLRVSIGASDLNDRVFSYNDLPAGQTDVPLAHFDLNQDKKDVIPILKQILAINPVIKILGSPWSAPVWMKTNHNIQGGKLQKQYYDVYARYFVKYIQAMKKEGITIDAITLQNEPFNNGNTPSMQMFAKEQALFIRQYVGPLFKQQGIKTKIILYDHNCDAPEYAISILTETATSPYVDGSGFHLYAGPVTAMSKVHNAFPDKGLYFTEMMAVNRREFNIAAPTDRIVIGATRNWSRNVILWNLAANSANQPHTGNGGCSMCQGAVTIDGDSVQRNLAYYTIAHASKFVPPLSVRLQSNESDSVSNVAFKTPQGTIVTIVANKIGHQQSFTITHHQQQVRYSLNRGDVATFVW